MILILGIYFLNILYFFYSNMPGLQIFNTIYNIFFSDLDWDWSSVREATHRVPIKGVTPCESVNQDSSSCLCNKKVYIILIA